MIFFSSPLKVKEDDEVDNLDIKLDAKRKTKRVYQSPNTEVNLKISRSLKVSIHFSVSNPLVLSDRCNSSIKLLSLGFLILMFLFHHYCMDNVIWMILWIPMQILKLQTDSSILEYNLFCLVG